MFFNFSPFVFLFSSFYFVFLFSSFYFVSFFYLWVIIEVIMFIFMGISYCILQNSYSSLISYFLIQSFSSFLLLISYFISSSFIITLSVLLKLSMFPFVFWYFNVVYPFPPYTFFLASTMQKLPIFLALKFFALPLYLNFFWFSIIVTTLLSGGLMVILSDFRMVLLSSSVSINSWLFISHYSPIVYFLVYFLVYSLSFLLLLSIIGSSVKPISHYSPIFYSLLALSGLPPFPLFFLKIVIVFNYGLIFSFSPMFLIFLVFYCSVVSSYIYVITKYLVNKYSCSVNYFL